MLICIVKYQIDGDVNQNFGNFLFCIKMLNSVNYYGLIQGKRDKKILKIFFFAEKLKIVSLVDIMEGPCHLDPL